MTIKLTENQQKDLDTAESAPIRVVDPRTNAAYVLVRASDYETVREIIEDERRQKAIRKVALRNAGGRMKEAPAERIESNSSRTS